jgi:nucleotide-binding universal stress UspA family protein
MLCSILLAVADRPCARAALRTLQALSAHPEGVLVVLGVVHPFRTIYAHKHPMIGRRIRNLLWQSNCEQTAAVEQVVRQTADDFEASGWDVRAEVREGPIADEILGCCRATCPQLLIVGSCVREALPLWRSQEIWQRVVREAGCPVLVVKHAEAVPSHEPSEEDVFEEAEVNKPWHLTSASIALQG